MNKILLSQDTAKIQTMKAKLQEVLSYLQRILELYYAFPFKKFNDTIEDIIEGVSEQCRNYIQASLPAELKGTNAANVIKLDGSDEIESLILAVKNGNSQYLNFFKVRNKQAVIDQAEFDKYVLSCSVYLEDPEVLNLLAALLEAAQALDKWTIDNLAQVRVLTEQGDVRSVIQIWPYFKVNPASGELEVNMDLVRTWQNRKK